MKKSSYVYFFLIFSLFLSCFEDNDDNIARTSEINDFVWRGMNAAYLYKDEITNLDNDRFGNMEEYFSFLNNYDSPEALFESLIHERNLIDKYSLIIDDYIELQQYLSGNILSNGIEFGLSFIPNSNYEIFGYVRYVHSGSVAEANGIKRGDIFISVNNTILNIDNYSNLLSQNSYEMGFAIYLDNNTNDISDDNILSNGVNIYLSKVPLVKNPVYNYSIINEGGKKIGYLMYNQFLSNYDSYIESIFSEFKSNLIDEIIIDLRYNPGGSVNSALLISSLLTGQFTNEIFSYEEWNSEIQNYWNNNNPEYLVNRFLSLENSLKMNKIYVLTSRSTASASELLINCLSPYINVVQIGTSTYGKYQASITLYDSNNFSNQNTNPAHNYAIQPLVMKTLNVNGVTDYYNGLEPDYIFEERPYNMGIIGELNEPMLNYTINLINQRSVSFEQSELFGTIGDNFKFEYLDKEMYIDKSFLNINEISF